MIKSRRTYKKPANLDRWLVSYADFITLLFAFFVVLYAISSVNIGKYRIVSSTIDQAFKSDSRSIKPIQVGDLARSPTEFTGYNDTKVGESDYPLQKVSEALDFGLELDISSQNLSIKQGDHAIEIEINNGILFKSGGNELKASAIPMIKKIANVLEPYPNAIKVEGFTDNIPIDNIYYPSNWDLSVARAATVTRTLELFGVDPRRLAAIGYGEFQPVGNNDTAAGRQANRRVVILIEQSNTVRQSPSASAADKVPEQTGAIERSPVIGQPERAQAISNALSSSSNKPKRPAQNLQNTITPSSSTEIKSETDEDGRVRFIAQ